jgi:transglutaminase/protease-like cytokinesis protein 3
MKNRLLIILFLIFTNYVSSQNKEIKLLVEKTEKLNLDMWELSEFAEKNLKNKNEIARFFYYWIGKNIEYDHEFFRKMRVEKNIHEEYLKKQDEYRVYEDRKGVCGGYANLFKWFMMEADIEVEYIIGHIRDERNHYVELSSDKFTHAWNSIKLNGKWILIDTTWGSSYNISQSEFYFDIKPELSINTHYPKNSKWQLLKKPLSLEDFNNSKFVKLIWFFSGFTDIPKLKKDNNYYYFVYKTNNENRNLSVKLLISKDNLNYETIENTVKIEQDGITYVRFEKSKIPEKAFYKVHLLENDYIIYSNVLSFKT